MPIYLLGLHLFAATFTYPNQTKQYYYVIYYFNILHQYLMLTNKHFLGKLSTSNLF